MARPMSATNSNSGQARFTLPGEQHQQPGQDRRAISVPLASGNDRQSRSLAGTRMSSSAALNCGDETDPKLIVRVRFSSPAPSAQSPGQDASPGLGLDRFRAVVDLPGH